MGFASPCDEYDEAGSTISAIGLKLSLWAARIELQQTVDVLRVSVLWGRKWSL